MSSIFQKSFSSGEITPAMFARIDLAKYASGLRTARNGFVARHGGFYNRAGSVYCSTVSDSTHRVRLLPFTLPGKVYYQLEFGHLYVRILQDGLPSMTTVKDISAITLSSSANVTFKQAHSMHIGDEIVFSGVLGMTQINGLTGTITAVTGISATVNINSSAFTAYSSGGLATPVNPREIKYTTPYTEAMLRELTFAQQDTTMTIAHQSGYPLQLTYVNAENWTLLQSTALVVPAIGKTTITSGPLSMWNFVVTSANATVGATYTVAGNTYTVGFTIAAQTLLLATGTVLPPPSGTLTKTGGTGDATITYSSVTNNQFPALFFGVTAVAQDTFEESLIATWGLANGVAAPWTLNWTPVPGAIQYNIYRGLTLGFLDISTTNSYTDTGTLTPDTTSPPPIERVIFASNGGVDHGDMLPAVVGSFKQRRFYANMGPPYLSQVIPPPILPPFPNYADRIFGSRIGSPTYFNEQRPTPADGQLSFRMLHKKPQTIRHLLDLGRLAVFTEEGEWILGGDPNTGGITPTAVNPTAVSLNGSGFTPPLAIGENALYIQFNQKLNTSIVRTFGFQFQVDGYRGDDVTIFSSHLTDGFQLVSWDFQKLPHPIVWIARDDGILLGCTYLPEQSLIAWHRHDFQNGLVEEVLNSNDEIYLVIKRTINGSIVRYIEKFSNRNFKTISDAIFVDACKTIDGRNLDATKTMTLSGGTTWDYDETITLTSSSSFFSGASVGRFVHLRGPNNELIRFKISAQSSATVATGMPDKIVPSTMRNVALSNWADATYIVTGLDHLEGQAVSVLGDGFVVSSVNNDDYPTLIVSGGQITLSTGDVGYAVIQVGLPITTDLETLNIDNPQGPSMMHQQKLISSVDLWLENSRGVFVGSGIPDLTDDPTENLEMRFDELKYRYEEGFDDPNNLITKVESINIAGEWNSNGRVFVRQVDPLPMGILAISPTGFIPIGAP